MVRKLECGVIDVPVKVFQLDDAYHIHSVVHHGIDRVHRIVDSPVDGLGISIGP